MGLTAEDRRLDDHRRRRANWKKWGLYLRDRGHLACVQAPGAHARRLLSIVNREHLVRLLRLMRDENEFLSEFDIRSLSKIHRDHPDSFRAVGQDHTISDQVVESESGLFGGNSNWRGPVWWPS